MAGGPVADDGATWRRRRRGRFPSSLLDATRRAWRRWQTGKAAAIAGPARALDARELGGAPRAKPSGGGAGRPDEQCAKSIRSAEGGARPTRRTSSGAIPMMEAPCASKDCALSGGERIEGVVQGRGARRIARDAVEAWSPSCAARARAAVTASPRAGVVPRRSRWDRARGPTRRAMRRAASDEVSAKFCHGRGSLIASASATARRDRSARGRRRAAPVAEEDASRRTLAGLPPTPRRRKWAQRTRRWYEAGAISAPCGSRTQRAWDKSWAPPAASAACSA